MNHLAHPTTRVLNSLAALGSAILLSIAHANPDYWFVSLFALIPFLWRVCYVDAKGSIVLAIMLSTFFVLLTCFYQLMAYPAVFLFKLLSLNATFIVFAFGINRLKKSLGFDPLGIALIWFPIEYILISFANLGGVFSISEPGSKIVSGSCSLFGLILGSLIVVLINAVILWLLKYVIEKIRKKSDYLKKKSQRVYPRLSRAIFERCRCCLPKPRSPPVHALSQ